MWAFHIHTPSTLTARLKFCAVVHPEFADEVAPLFQEWLKRVEHLQSAIKVLPWIERSRGSWYYGSEYVLYDMDEPWLRPPLWWPDIAWDQCVGSEVLGFVFPAFLLQFFLFQRCTSLKSSRLFWQAVLYLLHSLQSYNRRHCTRTSITTRLRGSMQSCHHITKQKICGWTDDSVQEPYCTWGWKWSWYALTTPWCHHQY